MESFLLKPRIIFGEKSIEYFKQVNSKKAYIVTDGFMVKLGIVDKVTNHLEENNIKYEIFSEVEPNPSLGTVKKGLSFIISSKPDLVIALGGGSSIDAAKAMIYLCIKTKEKLIDISSIKKPLFVAIPTTSGTGSEATSYAVITDTENNQKIPLANEFMLPDVAILDYELTKTVPPQIVADTGMDVLTHAIESYVSNNSTDFSILYAEKAIRVAFKYLLSSYQGDDLARMKMHHASCMAGIAFQNSALGLNHSIAHSIGSKFHISHGRSNAILLPYVIKYNASISSIAEKYAKVSRLLGFPKSNTENGVSYLIETVKFLNNSMGIPLTLKEFGVSVEDFNKNLYKIADAALEDMCTKGNPRKVTKEDILKILAQAYN
ncbi:MAG: 1-propanol dehydrogenase PduQ [Clostridiaceae bacterium]